MGTLASLHAEFESIVGASLALPDAYEQRATGFVAHIAAAGLHPEALRRRNLIAHVNRKFRFNRSGIAGVYAAAAADGRTFNYHEKKAIEGAFDRGDAEAFTEALAQAGCDPAARDRLAEEFSPISPSETFRRLRAELASPSHLRRSKGDRPIDQQILLAAFSAYLFGCVEAPVAHGFFDEESGETPYTSSFWRHLQQITPQLYSRGRTLDVVRVRSDESLSSQYTALRGRTLALVQDSFAQLCNHGHLAVWIEPVAAGGRSVTWELASDLILFAEKHLCHRVDRGYFRWKQIDRQTTAVVSTLDPEQARFELANEGFTYRDTYVCPPAEGSALGTESLLLVFQKNQRDETVIPCPACRSRAVRGNSYPTLGVRSWECKNVLCPDRSKYNRGKRYSFRALLMQEAIEAPDAQVPPSSVRAWSKDYQPGRTFEEAVEMLIRHYSLPGDGVALDGEVAPGTTRLGRRVVALQRQQSRALEAEGFWASPWFHRYATPPSTPVATAESTPVFEREGFQLINGDARSLPTLASASFDAAVTSPPYYNAREYAQWANLYCHMHDMRLVGEEVFRVLKPGGLYLYNVFDTFDNERTIVFSAMGDKRIALSSLTLDAFRRVGFVCEGSITWYKGEIEGKRAFNGGNFSPYYQAPLNCWEHILVFRKPGGSKSLPDLPSVLDEQPVKKIVRGKNVHGHTAPFPGAIPGLLARILPPGSRVLDPFGGSCTTARALVPAGHAVTCVERSPEYCQLSLRLFDAEATVSRATAGQLSLFG